MKCKYCEDAEIIPMMDLFKHFGKDLKQFRLNFKKEFGMKFEDPDDLICKDCGQLYTKEGRPLRYKLNWLKK